ncbi:peptidoglycan DD-metalloendopeptidase family protein [Mailhella sp.]|uniref:peptidoglycan DD-metalloendopeptidase family protein n=1 Tax=Mailhella sp. TaxID=1981029 RepID=UPI0040647ADB
MSGWSRTRVLGAAGLVTVCLAAALSWVLSYDDEASAFVLPVGKDSAFLLEVRSEVPAMLDVRSSGDEVALAPVEDRLASLGSGLSWVRDFWYGGTSSTEGIPCYDASLSSFLSAREESCIPCYSDPVPWNEDPRYTLENNGCGLEILRTDIRKGDHLGSLFRQWLEKSEVNEAVKAVSSVFKVSRVLIGRPFSVERSAEDGRVQRLLYDIDDESRLVLMRTEKGFTASVDVYEFETRLVRVKGEVKSSLFEAMTEAGERSALAVQLADVFGHQINFVNDVQEGDSFELVVEKKHIGSEFRRYGDIVAARFTNGGRLYEAFRFFDDKGTAHYYAADGSSLETQFLKAPLNFTRISSRYSMHRRHPVFGKVRPHQGVDYAAPTGTPVKALGEGKVTFVGWKRGYGKSVAIRHNGGIETHYAHLSRYARGLKKGNSVDQGQIIAYVGATGTATGPHLDFRVKKNGTFIDPLKLSGGRSASIAPAQRRLFEKQVAQARLMLDGEAIVAVK